MAEDTRLHSLEEAWLCVLDAAPALADPRSEINIEVLRLVFMAGARAAIGLAGQGDLANLARDLNRDFPGASRVGGADPT